MTLDRHHLRPWRRSGVYIVNFIISIADFEQVNISWEY